MTFIETLKELHKLQIKYLNNVDIKIEVTTRKDMQTSIIIIDYCNYSGGYEKKSKLFVHKFSWKLGEENNNDELLKIVKKELKELAKSY